MNKDDCESSVGKLNAVRIANPPRNILPKPLAPICSEVKEMKQRRDAHTEQVNNRLGSASGFVFPPKETAVKPTQDMSESVEKNTSTPSGLPVQTQEPMTARIMAQEATASITLENTNVTTTAGSETKKAAENSEPQEESDSARSFRRFCGMSLNEFNEQKAVASGAKANDCASTNVSGG